MLYQFEIEQLGFEKIQRLRVPYYLLYLVRYSIGVSDNYQHKIEQIFLPHAIFGSVFFVLGVNVRLSD